MSDADRLLSDLISELESLQIRYMITGSLASGLYGRGRTTFDVDIVIDPSQQQLAKFIDAIADKYYVSADAAQDAFDRRSLFNVIDPATGTKVDLVLRKQRAFSETELGRARKTQFGDLDAYVASPEDVILSKLEWAAQGESERQLNDVASILLTQRGTLDLEYLRQWAVELGVLDSLERLFSETQQLDG